MSSSARVVIYLLGGFLIFLGSGFAASSLQTISRSDVLSFDSPPGPAVLPGAYNNFNPNNIPELQIVPPHKDANQIGGYAFDPNKVKYYLGSHRVPFFPASRVKPPPLATSIPIIQNASFPDVNLNEEEDDLGSVSEFHTDTTLYGNIVGGARPLSSRERGFFYEENLRYDLFTLRQPDDSLSLVFDSTFSNDRREYKESFILNQLTLESRTPKSLLAFGHSYPEFSNLTMTQQLLGFYGVQGFHNTTVKSFTGYKAMEKDDIKNPRWINGFRLEHQADEAIALAVSAVSTRDTRANPGANQDLPTLKNSLYSVDMEIKPADNVKVYGEAARSKTEFDLRTPLGEQEDTAYRFGGIYMWENFRIEGGVEDAGSAFLTPLGESPRDERIYFGHCFFELNRYFATKFGGRIARDNLANYKTATIVRNQPEFLLILHPSDYYRDMRIDFFYQPSHEYSDNVDVLDRYKDVSWLEINHKAGALRYFAGLTGIIDKYKIAPINDQDITKLDFKLTWEYDAFRSLYGMFSHENFGYKTAGGFDRTIIYGLGGKSQFHDDIDLALEYTHEANDVKTALADSKHDRVNISLTKEYNNQARVIIELEGSNNLFEASNRNFNDLAAKFRFLKSF